MISELEETFIELVTKFSNDCCDGKLPDDKSELIRFLLEMFYDGQSEPVKQCAAQHISNAIDVVRLYQASHWKN